MLKWVKELVWIIRFDVDDSFHLPLDRLGASNFLLGMCLHGCQPDDLLLYSFRELDFRTGRIHHGYYHKQLHRLRGFGCWTFTNIEHGIIYRVLYYIWIPAHCDLLNHRQARQGQDGRFLAWGARTIEKWRQKRLKKALELYLYINSLKLKFRFFNYRFFLILLFALCLSLAKCKNR